MHSQGPAAPPWPAPGHRGSGFPWEWPARRSCALSGHVGTGKVPHIWGNSCCSCLGPSQTAAGTTGWNPGAGALHHFCIRDRPSTACQLRGGQESILQVQSTVSVKRPWEEAAFSRIFGMLPSSRSTDKKFLQLFEWL